MTKDPKRITDGFQNLEGGMDAGLSPSIIKPNQVASAVNSQMRGGFIKPRPGYNRRALQFPGVESSLFEDGKFQGAKAYRTSTGDDVLMAAIGGRMFKVDLASGYTVQDITIPGSPNSSLLEYVWMAQGEQFFIVQDGISAPYIFDGASARRAGPGEIPTGTVIAYVQGRLWIASPDRHQFIASDLVYGPSGKATYNYRDSILKMTENDLLATGGAFSIPDSAGQITAMVPVANLDTSTGQGPLMVFTETRAYSINAPVDRTIWRLVTYPLQSTSMIGPGPVGQNVVVHVNSDIWYRSLSDIRSFVLSRRNFQLGGQNTWANSGMADEIRPILDADQKATLSHASSISFDNRLLVTISPVYSSHGTYFRGLVALDFVTVSGIGRQAAPAWSGIWSGVKILQVLTATVDKTERAFAFTLSAANKIELWEISRDAKSDNGTKPIQWSFETRSFRFNDGGFGLKQLMTGEQFIDELYGTVNFNLNFRVDQMPIWTPWVSWSECAVSEDCFTPICGEAQTGPKEYRLQYRAKTRFPQPSDVCNQSVGTPMNLGYEFQAREEIEGYCRFKSFVMHAHWRDEQAMGDCPTEGECQSVVGCDFNPFLYTAE